MIGIEGRRGNPPRCALKRLAAVTAAVFAVLALAACGPDGSVVKQWKESACQGSEAARCPNAYWLLIVTAWGEDPIPVSVTRSQYRACAPLDGEGGGAEYPACLKEEKNG